jgi:hypothetical protein
MNYEIKFICGFIMSIMVFSSFTPFAYAIKEPTTAELSDIKQVDQSCSDDVWFDELSWSEYQKLVNRTVQMIDGFGNQQIGAEEKAAEKSGVGTNADAINAKHIFLPGVNGQPALLYDIMKKKAVDPNSVCHLNNLFSSGRIAYAARLLDNVRYCSTAGSIYCDHTTTSTDVQNSILDVKNTLDAGKTTEGGLNETTVRSSLSEDQIKELEKGAPSAVVETSDARMGLNADVNMFFPQTATDFSNFIHSFGTIDTVISLANGIAMVQSVPNIVWSFGGVFQRVKIGIKGLLTRPVFSAVAAVLKANLKLGESAAALGKVAFSTKTEWKNSLTLFKNFFKQGSSDFIDLIRGSKTELRILDENGKSVLLADYMGVMDPNTADGVKKMSKILSALKGDTNDITSAMGICPGCNAQDISKVIQNAVGSTAGYKNILNLGGSLEDSVKGISTLAPGFTKISATQMDELTKMAESISNNAAALSTVAAGPVTYASVKSSVNAYSAAVGLTKWQSRAVFAGELFKAFMGKGGGLMGKLMLGAQVTQSLFMGSLWFRNNLLSNPQFNAQGVIEFQLNNDIANYVDKQDEAHYLDVKKTYGIPSLTNFVTNIIDQFLITTEGGQRGELTDLQKKVQNIRDIVFILDQDALIPASENSKAVNMIASPSNSSSYWGFLSRFPSSTLIYNFEHPSGYTPSGKSALFLGLKNINIYGVSGMPNEWFTSPIDPLTSGLRTARDIAGTLMLFGAVPASASFVAGWKGGVLAGVFAVIFSVAGYQATIDIGRGGYEEITDVKNISPDQLCKNKFTGTDKFWISAARYIRAGLAVAGVATGQVALREAKAASAALKGARFLTPAFIVDAIVGIGQLVVGYLESNAINRITNDLKTCVDTNFDVLSFKEIPEPQALQNQTKDFLSPMKSDLTNIFNMLSPEIGAQFDNLAQSMLIQVMHLQVDAKDTPLVSLVGKEVYNVHFKDADIKWFQGAKCNIDLCQQSKGGYKCITQNGYRLIDENGNPILDGIPQAASLRMNMKEGYMGIVQRAIEVKKKNSTFFEVYPDKTVFDNDCLKDSLANLTGTASMPSVQEKTISDTIGQLETIYTPDAQIWFDGQDVATQFFNEKTCSDGITYGSREVFRFTGAHLKVYRDNNGKIEIIGSDNKTKCDFNLGSEGAIGFSNALIRSGFAQDATTQTKAANFTGVYHIFIYDLVSADKNEISKYSMNQCILPDGTMGFRPVIESNDAVQQEQWTNLLGGMCYANVEGYGNSSVTFNDSMITVVDPKGVTKTYRNLGYDSTCGNGLGGYQVIDVSSGEQSCLYLERGPDGQPQIRADAQASVPLLWATGMGGSFMYDPSSGRISIKNEFPFAINPNFGIYGAGGLGMMTPTLPPWGGNVAGTGEAGASASNILAALPWMPDGLELMLVIIAIAGGLLVIRIRYRKVKAT